VVQAYLDTMHPSGLDFALGSPRLGGKPQEGGTHHQGGSSKAMADFEGARMVEGTPNSALIPSGFHQGGPFQSQPGNLLAYHDKSSNTRLSPSLAVVSLLALCTPPPLAVHCP